MFTRARLSLVAWNVLVIGLVLLVAGTIAYVTFRRNQEYDLDRALAEPAGGASGPRFDAPGIGLRPGVQGGDRRFYLVVDAAGTVLADPQHVGIATVPVPRHPTVESPYLTTEIAGEPVRLYFRLASVQPTDWSKTGTVTLEGASLGPLLRSIPASSTTPVYLVAGRSLVSTNQSVYGVLVLLLLAGLAGLGVALLGAWFLAGRALVPIERAFRRQQEFVSDAAHELRTPLTVLRTSTEILDQDREAPLKANGELFDDLKAEIERMARLTADLLILARSDRGQLDLAVGEFDLGVLAADVTRRLGPLAAPRGLSLSCAAEGRTRAEVDPDRVRQVLLILLDNALKHTPAGGEVKVLVRGEARDVTIAVRDTGAGIPPEHLARVFDRFYQVDPSRSRGGTGLGLAIAKTLAQAHGGRLALASQPRVGTTATVSLPRTIATAGIAGRLRRLIARLRPFAPAIIDRAIESHRRQTFLAQTNRGFARLRKDPSAWPADQEEREARDATLADGPDQD